MNEHLFSNEIWIGPAALAAAMAVFTDWFDAHFESPDPDDDGDTDPLVLTTFLILDIARVCDIKITLIPDCEVEPASPFTVPKSEGPYDYGTVMDHIHAGAGLIVKWQIQPEEPAA